MVTGQWYKWTIIMDSNRNLQMYLNSVNSNTATLSSRNIASGNVPKIDRLQSWLGRSHWENDPTPNGVDALLHGSIDQFRIYERELTMDEIDTL